MKRELLGCDDCQVLMRQVLDQNWYIANDVLQRVLSPCQIHALDYWHADRHHLYQCFVVPHAPPEGIVPDQWGNTFRFVPHKSMRYKIAKA